MDDAAAAAAAAVAAASIAAYVRFAAVVVDSEKPRELRSPGAPDHHTRLRADVRLQHWRARISGFGADEEDDRIDERILGVLCTSHHAHACDRESASSASTAAQCSASSAVRSARVGQHMSSSDDCAAATGCGAFPVAHLCEKRARPRARSVCRGSSSTPRDLRLIHASFTVHSRFIHGSFTVHSRAFALI